MAILDKVASIMRVWTDYQEYQESESRQNNEVTGEAAVRLWDEVKSLWPMVEQLSHWLQHGEGLRTNFDEWDTKTSYPGRMDNLVYNLLCKRWAEVVRTR